MRGVLASILARLAVTGNSSAPKRAGQGRPITRSLDRGNEVKRCDLLRVVGDRCHFGRVVHRRIRIVESVQRFSMHTSHVGRVMQ